MAAIVMVGATWLAMSVLNGDWSWDLFAGASRPNPATEIDDGTPSGVDPVLVGPGVHPTGPVPMEWTYLPLIDGEMFALANGPGGFVAVGRSDRAGGIWLSPDGLTWEEVPHDDDLFGVRDSDFAQMAAGDLFSVVLLSIAADSDGYVALGHAREFGGTFNEGGNPTGKLRPAAWTSCDGRKWQRVPFDEAGFATPTESVWLHDVTAGGPAGSPRYVAVGAAEVDTETTIIMVWISEDGAVWDRIPHDPDVFGSPRDEYGHNMRSVAAGPNGYLATGIRTPGERVPVHKGVVWTSPDGREWARSSAANIDMGGFYSSAMLSVSSWGHSFIASQGDRLWITEDGSQWHLALERPEGALNEIPWLSDAAGGPLIVTGSCGVYTSPDGEDWTLWEETLDCPVQPVWVSIAWGPDNVVAVGPTNDPDHKGKSGVLVGRITSG